MHDCDLGCRRYPASKSRREVVAPLNNRNHRFHSLASDLLSDCNSYPGETQTISKFPDPGMSSSAKDRKCYMAAFKKVHSLRMFQAVLRGDYRQALHRMVFQQSSHEYGSTMMVGGWEFSNEDQLASPRSRPIPLTTQWFA